MTECRLSVRLQVRISLVLLIHSDWYLCQGESVKEFINFFRSHNGKETTCFCLEKMVQRLNDLQIKTTKQNKCALLANSRTLARHRVVPLSFQHNACMILVTICVCFSYHPCPGTFERSGRPRSCSSRHSFRGARGHIFASCNWTE